MQRTPTAAGDELRPDAKDVPERWRQPAAAAAAATPTTAQASHILEDTGARRTAAATDQTGTVDLCATCDMLQPHAELQAEPTLLGRVLRRLLTGGPIFIILGVLTLPPGADGAIVEHEITALPGWDHPLPSRQYSGFISAEETSTPGHERYLHYVFVEAENSPETAPVVLWTNGGPGCSSLEGYMNEMGPLRPDSADPDGQRLTRNPYTWNVHANMLYLEHGVGVGFSYSNGGNVQLDDESDAHDVYWFLRNFFFPQNGASGFGEYATNEFYLTGESYAGIYIPHIANTIRLGNLNTAYASTRINIVGFMIGNGCSGSETFNCGDPIDNTDFLKSSGGMKLDFLHGHGLVGDNLFDEIVESCPDPKPDWGYDSQCSGLTQEPMCGLDIQEFIDQFFNPASCMGPVPAEYLGQGFETSGKWEVEGGTAAGYSAEYLNAAWNSSIWPMIAGADADFVAQQHLTAENTWRMDRPGPQLDPRAIPDAWPLNADGSVPHSDPLGRRVNLECCVKYDEAFERLGTINIYNIDDQACTPGSLSEKDHTEGERPAVVHWSHERALGAKGIHLDSDKSVRATAFDAATMRNQLHKPGYSSGLVEPSRDLDACGGASFNVGYFNRPDVQKALHVFEKGPVTSAEETGWSWTECSRAPFFNYTKTTKSHTELYQQHLVPEMRVTIFSGDVDACVPYLGTMRWVDDVVKNTNGIGDREPWPEIGVGWTNWNVDANVAGYFSTWDVTGSNHTFTFATVKGAGHMVPEVKPKSAASLFYRFLNNLPMNHAEMSPLAIKQQPIFSAGENLLTVVATGGATPYSYEWFRNDELIEGSYGPDLVLSEEQLSTDAEYHCHIISALGSTLWTEGVRVPPHVTAGPYSASTRVVDKEIFEAVAFCAFGGGLAGGLIIAVLAWVARTCSQRGDGSSNYRGPKSDSLLASFQ